MEEVILLKPSGDTEIQPTEKIYRKYSEGEKKFIFQKQQQSLGLYDSEKREEFLPPNVSL